MRFRQLRYPVSIAALLAWLGGVSSLFAQEVFVTAPNNKILEVDFATGDTEVVVSDPGTNFRGLVVRRPKSTGGLRLIVANKTHGGEIRVYDASTGDGARIATFGDAEAVALSSHGDIFAVNKTHGGKDQVLFIDKVPGCPDRISGPFPPDCKPGGYRETFLIDKDVKLPGVSIKELADVRLAKNSGSGLFDKDQLLVLVRNPAMVIAYTPDDHDGFEECAPDCDAEIVVPKGVIHHTPTGLEIAGDSLLITTEERRILRVKRDGSGVHVSTFADLPGKGAKLSVGTFEKNLVVSATVSSSNGRALLFDADGAQLDEVKKNIKVPEGISSETSNVVVTATGDGVGISLDQIDATFTRVVDAGITDSNCQFYPHPRPDCTGPDCTVFLDELGFPHHVKIPEYLQPFPLGDTGVLQYLVCTIDTTASFEDTIESIHEEINSLGYELECSRTATGDARMAWAPIPGVDPEITEGDRFIDITVGCGNSHRGRGWDFSYVLPIVDNTRCTGEQLFDQHTNLLATFRRDRSDIEGPCPNLRPGGTTVPKKAFRDAGLGKRDRDWSLMDPSAFGAGGNGLLLGGGMVEFEFREAGFGHQFGTANTDGSKEVVFDTASHSPGAKAVFAPSEEPYLFYFQNTSGHLSGKHVFSNGRGDPGLSMAVYRNVHDPRLFALFFDDGGNLGSPGEPDYDDMIVTARGIVEARCHIGLALEDAIEAFEKFDDGAACLPSNIRSKDLALAMDEILAVADAQPEAFDGSSRNTIGELKARAEAIIYQACKILDVALPFCPVP